MSGDGTYYTSGGSGGKGYAPSRVAHPPLTDDPHDPVHYYQGVDGRFYYTPDGEPHPEFGQPPVKPTEKPLEYRIKPLDNQGPWKHEASQGYKIHPDGLRELARRFQQDLTDLKYVIQQSAQPDISGAAGAMGNGYEAAEDYDKLARSSSTAFSQQYGTLIATYENVINLLKLTAENGQTGEDNSRAAVTQTGTQVGGYAGGSNIAV